MNKIFIKRGERQTSREAIKRISKKYQISDTLAEIILNRMPEEDIEEYLNSDFSKLHDPFLFNDMQIAVDRINKAFEENERITVWGDFDCDGVSGTSIMMLELSQSTENLSYYIPSRMKEGYGVNKEGIKKLHEEGTSLIITVDCGITSMEEVEYAKELGIDMIITDHHRADKGRPDALAVINPKVEGEKYPFDGLCGAAVASKLTQALYGFGSLMRTIDILAMATVADLVPLKGENRIFVRQGLKAINYAKRPAIQEMSKYALKDNNEEIKAYHFGFRYGPMINASGRIGDASDAVELFITKDPNKRQALANKLNEYNTSRKARETIITEDVNEQLQNKEIKSSIVVYGEGWEPGIVGIVASRVLEEYYRPTIVLTHFPEKGVYKGSGRSISGIDLYDALLHNEEYLGNWGGHAEAAGMEVKEDKIEEFIEALDKYIEEKYPKDTFIPKVKYDLNVNLVNVNYSLIKEIERLEPFGIGNPSIYLKATNVSADAVSLMGKDKEHFSAFYADQTASIKGVSFFKEPPTETRSLDIVFKPNLNEFLGKVNVQLLVNDFIPHLPNPEKDGDADDESEGEVISQEELAKDSWSEVDFSTPPNIVKVEDFIDNKTKVKQFKNANIHTNIDMIKYIPKRFHDLTRTYTVQEIRDFNLSEEIVNIILFLESTKISGNHVFASGIDINGEKVSIAWFNQAYLHHRLKTQQYYSIYGKLDTTNAYRPQIVPLGFTADIEASKIILPEYKKVKGMSDDYLTESIKKAFELTEKTDFLEKDIVLKYDLVPEIYALYNLHFPGTLEHVRNGARRDLFQSLFKFNFKLKHASMGSGKKNKVNVVKTDLVDKLIDDLPFTLTADQDKAVRDSIELMNEDTTLQGLVQGDVGSGKTIVSILLMTALANNGYQSALIAPTEVLARQHYEEVVELLGKYDIKVGYLSGGLKVKERREVLKGIKDGSIHMVVGTHAVIQDTVEFDNLGLVVIDEQHRFGVEQREKLRRREQTPHVILMSATPIPRTLSMSLYGENMHVFNIKTMPSGRLPIKTEIIMNDNDVYNFVYLEIKKGRQAYVVCPLIEESESEKMKTVKSLEVEYENIKNFFNFDPSVKIEMISGKMKQKEINEIVESFERGEVHILLSTTIIEVGVNVPNSSVMVIKSSDRFGLAQLHQLRGRVGRGKYQSYCILQPTKPDVKAEIIKSTTDGFKIAEHDLELRGHGNLVGTEQTGSFKEVSMMLTNPKLYDIIANENNKIFEDSNRLASYLWIIDEQQGEECSK